MTLLLRALFRLTVLAYLAPVHAVWAGWTAEVELAALERVRGERVCEALLVVVVGPGQQVGTLPDRVDCGLYSWPDRLQLRVGFCARRVFPRLGEQVSAVPAFGPSKLADYAVPRQVRRPLGEEQVDQQAGSRPVGV